MKKFYKIKTLAVVAFALMANVAFSQTLKLTANGEPVANGDVINLPYEFEDYSMPEINFYMYNFTWDPHLEASTTTGEADLTVTVTSIDGTEGFQMCWPMNCNAVSPDASAVASGKITTTPSDLKIDKVVNFYEAGALPTEGGSVKVKLECGSEVMEITVNAILADKNGVGENMAESNVAPEYYTIQGVRVAEPQKGQLVIERKGSKATKRIF